MPELPEEPVIILRYAAICPHQGCDWVGEDNESEDEARSAYAYHLKWAVHGD